MLCVERGAFLLWMSFSCFWIFPFSGVNIYSLLLLHADHLQGQLGFIPVSQDTGMLKFDVDNFRMNPISSHFSDLIIIINALLFYFLNVLC